MNRKQASKPDNRVPPAADASDRELYEAAELLGAFPEESSVEYAHAAQAELALKVEYSAPEIRSPNP